LFILFTDFFNINAVHGFQVIEGKALELIVNTQNSASFNPLNMQYYSLKISVIPLITYKYVIKLTK